MGSIFGWYSHLFWHDPFEGYMLGDWVKLTVAIGGGLFWAWGTWRAFRFSKSQISQRLLEFLKTNEEEALNSRKNLLRKLEFGETVERLVASKVLERTFGVVQSSLAFDTKAQLQHFQGLLVASAKIGEQHRDIANRQAATVLLLMGIHAMRHNQSLDARRHLQQALDLTKSDADVRLQLARLEFELGNTTQCQQQCDAALVETGADDELRARILELRSNVHRSNGNPLLERSDLTKCAPVLLHLRKWELAAQAYYRLAELQENFGPMRQVPISYIRALRCYQRIGDQAKVDELTNKLSLSPARQEDSPDITDELWQWMRLTIEIAILLSGVYMLVSQV
jgi:tetratricopeptide (TPR) repeat protein